MTLRPLIVLLALALAATSLAACGKKSRLDPPPGEKSDYPKVYPRQ